MRHDIVSTYLSTNEMLLEAEGKCTVRLALTLLMKQFPICEKTGRESYRFEFDSMVLTLRRCRFFGFAFVCINHNMDFKVYSGYEGLKEIKNSIEYVLTNNANNL